MKLMAYRARINSSRNKGRTAAIFLFVMVIEHWALWQLPIYEIDSTSNWPIYLARSVSAVLSILMIWFFAPQALQRIRIKFSGVGTLKVVAVIIGYFLAGLLVTRNYELPFWVVIDGGIFALFIGLDEEIFDRGLIFGLFEKWGTEFALLTSSVIFGLQHITNFFSGDDSFNYVLGHMINAAGFGYLMGAFKLSTGTIWVPVFLHGFADYRWVLMEPSEALAISGGQTNWIAVTLSTCIMVVSARIMLSERNWLKLAESKLLKRLGFE